MSNTPGSSRRSDASLASTRSAGSRRWDETPSRRARSPLPSDFDDNAESENTDWDQDNRQLDREWYDMEEGGVAADEEHNPFAQYEDMAGQVAAPLAAKKDKVTARQAQYNADSDAWERNRLQTSGVGPRSAIDLDNMDDDAESRVHLLVHDLKPPFLDGKTVFTKQLEPINPVKDGLSDMAIFARKGSRLVRETREKAERAKAAGKVAAMGGTTLGNILGVKADDDQDDPAPSQPLTPTAFKLTRRQRPKRRTRTRAEATRSSPSISNLPRVAPSSAVPRRSKSSASSCLLSHAATISCASSARIR